MPTRRTFVTLATAALASVGAAPAFAVGNLVDLEVVDRARNETLSTWLHRGVVWVAGRPGTRYALRLTNRSDARVLVVLSVDGVNAVSGETAAVDQTGYVLAPYQTTEITGWRKSLTEAAAFYFTALPDSYAARTDRPDNVGAIGAAVFREREVAPPPRRERLDERELSSGSVMRRSADAAPAPSAKAASPSTQNEAAAAPREDRLGTGHGEREYAPTTQTAFERASERPSEVVKVRYDSYANLLALGVIRPRPQPVRPDPFPRFVPDPKG